MKPLNAVCTICLLGLLWMMILPERILAAPQAVGLRGDVPTYAVAAVNTTTVGAVTATARASTWIAVEAPLSGDANRNGYAIYELGLTSTGPFTSSNTVWGSKIAGDTAWQVNLFNNLSANTAYYAKVTYVDPEGVTGPNPQIVGPITTSATAINAVTVETATAAVNQTEILVSAPIQNDANRNSGGVVEVATASGGPWTRKCGSPTEANLPLHPKRCRIRSLNPNTNYWIRVTITDPDGVSGVNPQIIGPVLYTGLANLALNKSITADPGWGCCPNPAGLVNGRIQSDNWMYDFAWTGGTGCWGGGCPPGFKQATIDFGTPTTFNRAVVWYHGGESVPLIWKFQYSLDGSTWLDLYSNTEPMCRTSTEMMPVAWYHPACGHDATFPTVTARYFRYIFDDRTLFGGAHGWAMEIEVFNVPPTVQLSTAAYTVAENAGSATLTATLSATSTQTVTVSYATSNGTAIAGSDYTSTVGSLSFPPGTLTRTFTVPIINNALNENSETLQLTLSNPLNASLGTPPTATLTIVDDDPQPTVQFSNLTLAYNRTVDNGQEAWGWADVVVDVAGNIYVSGSSHNGSNNDIRVIKLDSTGVVVWNVTYDAGGDDGPNKIALDSAGNVYVGGHSTAAPAGFRVIKYNNAGVRQWVANNPSGTAGALSASVVPDEVGNVYVYTGESQGYRHLLKYDSAGNVVWAKTDTTASCSQFGDMARDVAGYLYVTSYQCDIFRTTKYDSNGNVVWNQVYNPGVWDYSEDIALDGAGNIYVSGNSGDNYTYEEAVLLKYNNAGNLQWVRRYNAGQYAGGWWGMAADNAGNVYWAVSKNSSIGVPVDMHLVQHDSAGNFKPVIIYDSGAKDAPGGIAVSSSGDAVYMVGQSFNGTNDDFRALKYTRWDVVPENSGVATATAILSAPSALTITVALTSANITAIAGSDYGAVSGTLVFPPGALMATYPVTILNDLTNEPTETLRLTLGNPINAVLSTTTTTLTIQDDDPPLPTVQFGSGAFSVAESTSAAIITATLSAPYIFTVTVAYTTAEGTALTGLDFGARSGTLTFAPGMTTTTFSVPIIPDQWNEVTETVQLALSSPVSATLGTPAQATLEIIDDDGAPTCATPNNWSGTQATDTWWHRACSPYHIVGNLGVAPGYTLAIESGVEVLFDGNYNFNMGGTLLASGLATQPITFTGNVGMSWGRIYFDNQSVDATSTASGAYTAGNLLRQVQIISATQGIGCNSATPYLDYVTLTGGGVNCTAGNTQMWVKDSDVTGNVSIIASASFTEVTGSWAVRTSMPTGRAGPGVAAASNGKIYAVSGYNYGILAVNEEYNPATNSWNTRAQIPTARGGGIGAAASNGKFYVLGGNNGTFLATVEEYDPTTNTWVTRTQMPTARWHLGVTADSNGTIYAVGGWNGSTLSTFEKYNPTTNTWTPLASMPTAREGVGVAVAGNGKLYAIGGWNGSPLAIVEEYDPTTNTWLTRAPMPTARGYLGVVVASNGKLYAIGGTNGLSFFTTVEEYDPATDRWATRANMPTARDVPGVAVASNGKLYIIGGYDGGNNLATNEEFTAPTIPYAYHIHSTIIRNGNLTMPADSQVFTSIIGGVVSLGSSGAVQNSTTTGGIIISGSGLVEDSTTGGTVSLTNGTVRSSTINNGSINLTSGNVLSNTIRNGGITVGTGLVQGNDIENASGWGIAASGTATVRDNRVVGSANGVSAQTGLVQHNLIANSVGIGLQVSGANVLTNTLTGNGGNALVIDAGAPVVQGNNLEFNRGAYDVVNNTANAITATANWLGTTNTTFINIRILDFLDDFNLGQVHYTPILTSPAQEAPAYVRALTLTPPSPAGLGTTTFDVWFSRPMQASLAPLLALASSATVSYTNFSGGQWLSANQYRATYIFTPQHPRSPYTLTVANAVGTDALRIAPNTAQTLTLTYPPFAQFSTATYTVTESSGAATLTVALDITATTSLTLSYTTLNGSALAGPDYLTTTSTLTFTPGQTSRTLSVPIVEDALNEPTEALSVTLFNPVNAVLGTPITLTLVIVDDNDAPLAAADTFTVTEDSGNLPLAVLNNDSDPEGDLLTITAVGNPNRGGQAVQANALITYTPLANFFGIETFTYTVADGNGGFATALVTVNVTNVNDPPLLNAIGPFTLTEGLPFTHTVTATDPDLPLDTLTYTLGLGAPAGASIDLVSGVFVWLPTEVQGPRVYTLTTHVSDGVLTDAETFTLTVNEANTAPVLGTIGNQNIAELTTLVFTATAMDSDVPANPLTYSLQSAPAGASSNAATGAFTWTPTEADGPGVYTLTVRVSDGVLADTETFTITVNEVNTAPVLSAIGNYTVTAGNQLTFTVTATDADVPMQALTYTLDTGAPVGAHIDPATGVFTWPPPEAQAPGVYTLTVRVSDGALEDTQTFSIWVNAGQWRVYLPFIVR